MIDAWLSSSEQTSAPGPPNVVSTPRFAAKPVGKSDRALRRRFQSASSRSSSECTGREPTMRRAAPEPAPQRSSAACAAATTARVLGEAEVVVRRERDDRRGRRARACPRARRRRGRRGARQLPGGADRAGPARRPSSPQRHGSLGRPRRSPRSSDVHDPVDLRRRDRERRHEHDDVAERAEEHAALDRGRADPPAPAQAVGRRRELDAAHEPPQPDLARPRAAARCGRRAGRAARRSARARWRARRTRRSARGGAARPRPRARSRCTSARGTACARARSGPRNASNTRPLATVADIGR